MILGSERFRGALDTRGIVVSPRDPVRGGQPRFSAVLGHGTFVQTQASKTLPVNP